MIGVAPATATLVEWLVVSLGVLVVIAIIHAEWRHRHLKQHISDLLSRNDKR